MNQEEYYLNQDMTTECIQLPNQFQQGDCLIQQNYLSELSQNPGKALQNLGLDPDINNKVITLLECCDTVRQNITNITNDVTANYNDIQELTSRIDELPIDTNRLKLRYLIELGGDNVQVISPDNVISQDENWKNTIYLELYNYGDSLQKYYESYNGYIIKQIDHGGGASEYKWVQISQSLFPDNDIDTLIAQLVSDNLSSNLENYLIKNTSNNQGDVNIVADEFKISSPLTITDDSTLLKYNDDELITYNNQRQLIFNSNNGPLYRTHSSGYATIYDSQNFNADTIKVYKTWQEGDIIQNNTSFKDALLALENVIKNLPSGGDSGECDCPELPNWLNDYIDNAPEFGDKNKIETIELNGNELSITNKTVNIQETITRADGGLTIDNNHVVKHTNSINDTLPNSEILCKIKFDEQGHITNYQEVSINDLAAQLLNTGLFEPSSSYIEVDSVQITPASATLTDNNPTQQLSATTYGTNNQEATNQNVTWSSSDPSIVSVDSNGLITGQKTGEATITATSYNGKTANINVTVQFSTVYYFSIGTEPITADNYTRVNNVTTIIPETETFSTQTRAYGWILAPDTKTVAVVNNANSNIIPITEQTSISIANQKVYRTNGALSVGGTIKITLT